MTQNASPERQRCRILNIGPNFAVRRLLAGLAQADELVSIGHIETGAIGLDTLLALPEPELPHLVIIPSQLPVLTGRQFIRAMRSHSRLQGIPIFVWGSEMTADQIEQMYRAGADSVFPGQFSATHLDALRQFVRNTAGVDEHSRGIVASPVRRTAQSYTCNTKLGKLFMWIGCVSMLLWSIAGDSYVDFAALTVYAALTGAGLLLMYGRTQLKAPVLN